MNVLISKLAQLLIYPVGILMLLLLLALLSRLFGMRGVSKTLVGLGLVVIVFSSTPIAAKWLASRVESQFPPVAVAALAKSEAVVMLGGVLAPPIAPRLQVELVGSSDRILHTARIYKQGKAKRIYLSGGNAFPGYSELGESHYAKSLLEEWGVPAGKIQLDDRSKSTYENAVETSSFLSEKGLINKPVILVTSALHMPRAVETFRAENIQVIPASTDIQVTEPAIPAIFDWIPSVDALQLTTAVWHEMVALWYYRFRGWAIR